MKIRVVAATVIASIGLAAGIGTAAISASVTGTNVCATASVPAHTLMVDTTPATTIAGATDTQCAPIPTVTTTVTQTVTTSTTPTTTTTPAPSYIFDDEFNGAAGSKPSTSLWGVKTSSNSIRHWNGWNNISEDGNGDLVITAQKDSSGVWQTGWLSGIPGYSGPRTITVRAMTPCGAGTWSAPAWEWAYPYGAAPGLENDVNEQLGYQPTAYHTTLHYWTSSGGNNQVGQKDTTPDTLCGAFHVYSAQVFADHIDYFYDGTKVFTATAAQVGAGDLTAFKEVMNIDLDMGGWGGTIDPNLTQAKLLVDYVRVSSN